MEQNPSPGTVDCPPSPPRSTYGDDFVLDTTYVIPMFQDCFVEVEVTSGFETIGFQYQMAPCPCECLGCDRTPPPGIPFLDPLSDWHDFVDGLDADHAYYHVQEAAQNYYYNFTEATVCTGDWGLGESCPNRPDRHDWGVCPDCVRVPDTS